MRHAPRRLPPFLLPLGLAIVVAAAAVPIAAGAIGVPGTSPRPGTGTGPQTWTSGAHSASNSTDLEFGYEYRSTFQSDTTFVVRATNVSSTTVDLETWANASGSSVSTYCTPSCASPSTTMTTRSTSASTMHILEVLVTHATVDVNGTTAAALGVQNASETDAASSSFNETVVGNASTSGNLTVATTSSESGTVDFGPGALGLIPWTVPNDSAWNDTAGYGATIAAAFNATVAGDLAGPIGMGILGAPGAVPAPLVPGPSNGSGGGNGTGVPALIGPMPWPGAYMGSGAILCPPNATALSNGTAASGARYVAGTCSFNGRGSETSYGAPLWAFYGIGGGVYGSGSGNASGGPSGQPVPPPTYPPPLWRGNGSTGVFVSSTGPYLPGPGLVRVVPGSDLFGGAAAHWGPINAFPFGPLGGPGPYGGGAPGMGSGGSPPRGQPGGSSDPAAGSAHTNPSATDTSPAMRVVWVAALGGLAAVLLVAAILLRRRDRGPPGPPGPP